jgi:hypothetical protein
VVGPKSNGEHLEGSELTDIQRLTRNRADKVQIERELLALELGVARREAIPAAEVIRVFEALGAVMRIKLLRLRTDLPSALLGLDCAGIDKVLEERFAEMCSSWRLPPDFFNSRSVG